MEKLLSKATITPFLCCSCKTGMLTAHYTASHPIWSWIILMTWPPFSLADWSQTLWYSICMSGVMSGFTHKGKTRAIPLPALLSVQFLSIGKSWKTPTDHRKADIWSLKADISALPVWNYFISGFLLIEEIIYVITKGRNNHCSGLLSHAYYNNYYCRDSYDNGNNFLWQMINKLFM